MRSMVPKLEGTPTVVLYNSGETLPGLWLFPFLWRMGGGGGLAAL